MGMYRSSLIVAVFVALLGVTFAWFRPVQPVQIQQPADINMPMMFGLDNPAIPEDANIHPARKCGFCMG